MFQKLASRNDDIRRLIQKGYAVAFDSNCLIVRDIPYLDEAGALRQGAFVAKIVFVDDERIRQDDHQIYFAGSFPHNMDGSPVANLGGGATTIQLSDACADVIVQRSFSNKPLQTGCYADFFDKIQSYTGLIAGPAIEKFGANPLTFRTVEKFDADAIFKFQDTLTSRAEIGNLTSRLKNDVIAIIGLGGTGAYVLDYMCKTPVSEIRAYDADEYHVHNAFRSPGRLMPDELGLSKAEVYQARYENFRNGLRCQTLFVDAECGNEFSDVTFAFVCVDKGAARGEIFALLIGLGIPFIDVGMGLKWRDQALSGMLRTTYYSETDGSTVRNLGLAETSDNPENLYRANIQIAELNALNASLAVMRYKQIRGFYADDSNAFHHLFGIGDMCGVGESDLDAIQAPTG